MHAGFSPPSRSDGKMPPFFLRGLEGSDWVNEERGRRLMESGTAEQSSGPVRIAIVAPSLKWVGGQSVQADLLVRHWRNRSEERRVGKECRSRGSPDH